MGKILTVSDPAFRYLRKLFNHVLQSAAGSPTWAGIADYVQWKEGDVGLEQTFRDYTILELYRDRHVDLEHVANEGPDLHIQLQERWISIELKGGALVNPKRKVVFGFGDECNELHKKIVGCPSTSICNGTCSGALALLRLHPTKYTKGQFSPEKWEDEIKCKDTSNSGKKHVLYRLGPLPVCAGYSLSIGLYADP